MSSQVHFSDEVGNLSQSLGYGRAVGQIYGYLYFCPEPQCLDDLVEGLGISKGSASMCVRQLERWDAVIKHARDGDRRDYYEASDWLGRILKNVLSDAATRRMGSRDDLLEKLSAADPSPEHAEFYKSRLKRLESFSGKLQRVWNSVIVRMLLR